jgi:hypothetical protein
MQKLESIIQITSMLLTFVLLTIHMVVAKIKSEK